MTTRQDLHRAIDELSEDQVQKVIRILEAMQEGSSRTPGAVDLTRYSGVLQLTEDPLTYQERVRDEWR
ncbi:MAG: hypothetical protein JO061_16605 [Acidobacteriaceae bacterium]|nr:hypothetical protein [Acidobacteriaceae bacterium]